MKHRLSTVVIATLLAIAPAALLRADSPSTPPMDSKEHHWDMDKMQKDLGLTNDQVTKLKAVMESEKATIKPLWDKERDLMKKLEEQVKNKASDSDILASLEDIKASHNAAMDQIEQFQSQKAAILTTTQRAKMLLRRMEHGDMMHERMKEGHGKSGDTRVNSEESDE